MATKDEVVSAITHIMNNIHSDQWRGKLNDFEYQQLKSIYEDSTAGDTPVKDTLIGSLRNQWPTLFDPKTGGEVNPREAPVVAQTPSASTSPAGSTGPNPGPESPKAESGQGSSSSDGSDELSGKAADAAKKLDTALAKNHSDINDANGQLSDAILSAKTSDEVGKGKLNSLKQSIIDEVNRIGPNAMDTRAGMEEFATFLQGKTSDILNVVRTANLDSESQAKVMDALTARFTALGKKGGQPGKPGADPDNPAAPGTPGEPGATPGAPGSPGTPADPGLAPDPLLSGALPSDSLLGAAGSALGPAAGALGALPGMLGSAIPGIGGGSGGGLGDLGSTIGSALRDANGPAGEDGKPVELKDQHTGGDDKHGEDNKDGKPVELKDQKPGADPNATPQQQPGTPANGVPVAAAGAAPGPDLTVKIEGLGDVKLDNAAMAMAGREVVAGGNVHDAYNRAGIALPPPGTPVTTNAVSPGKTVFGDVGQYVDHQIMALGDNKAWVNGKVVSLDQIEQGPNFLGWMHPNLPTPAAPVPVTAPGPVPAAAAPVIAASAPAAPSVSVGAAFPGLSGP
ncbi:DUF4226 domain-containing protein [Mycobacteroides abscessus]|uniref:DUF4226 domain-containing protein n=1 Tax=Mycobacteroides abscessus TaxID=36809 RepID=UPI0019D16907|nr:DUF4226 domain-containing protein [Mycobacteroides abscessus]QSN49631.1 DUF4226 domain-containing protein [Mycobacteroides abscessus subsp. abscessus]